MKGIPTKEDTAVYFKQMEENMKPEKRVWRANTAKPVEVVIDPNRSIDIKKYKQAEMELKG